MDPLLIALAFISGFVIAALLDFTVFMVIVLAWLRKGKLKLWPDR